MDDLEDDFFIDTLSENDTEAVEYKVLSNLNIQQEGIERIEAILGLPRETVKRIYREWKFNIDRLIEDFMSNEKKVLEKSGVGTLQRGIASCTICFEDDLDCASLDCGHFFCLTCYDQFIQSKLSNGEFRIECPQMKCSKVLLDCQVYELSPDSVDRYNQLTDNYFVDTAKHLKWCPAPNCEKIIECYFAASSAKRIVPSVRCSCGNSFCFQCYMEDHSPLICALALKWNKKSQDDSETINWLNANTKDCPKCKAVIEKNGGCNHMTCKKCTFEFCWVCLGEWKIHNNNYSCNKYVNNEEASESRQNLEKYIFYYSRFINHERNIRLESELLEKTEAKMEEIQVSTSLSWIEVQFYKKAVSALSKCRNTLKWTYAFAYYLKKTNQTELLENNQRDLEIAVETLAELIELPIDTDNILRIRQDIMNKSVYVESRRVILKKHILKGVADEIWPYSVSIK